MLDFMAVREDSKEPKENRLEGLSLFELWERVGNELITYRADLSTSSEEDREQVTEEYMKRTKSLREEVNKRERLYLEYHNSFI